MVLISKVTYSIAILLLILYNAQVVSVVSLFLESNSAVEIVHMLPVGFVYTFGKVIRQAI